MSTPPQKPTIRRLISSRQGGMPYERWPDGEAEILRLLEVDPSNWIGQVPHLHNESLVYFIKDLRRARGYVWESLAEELVKRTVLIARRWAQSFDELTTENIVLQVRDEILDLVLEET